MADNREVELRNKFSAAAASYDNAAILAREVGLRLDERLVWVKNFAPRSFADLGCATGDGVRALQRRYPDALPLAMDFSLPMLVATRARASLWDRLRGRVPRCVNADARALPCAAGSLDLIWSNLMLHWLGDAAALAAAFGEAWRVLRPGGLLHFAMLGPDTLKELRTAAAALDVPLTMPVFPDMHDVGDQLLMAGFADPVMEMEMLTLTYRSPRRFLSDQRHLGVRDGLLGRQAWRAWRRIFASWPRVDGVLPARFEIVYGHAWKMASASPALPDGRFPIRLHRL